MNHGRHARMLALLLALALVAGAFAPSVALAQENETATPTPTTTSSTTTTTTEDRFSETDVIQIVNEGANVSKTEAKKVYAYVEENGVGSFSDQDQERLYRWLLLRAAKEDVPAVVLDRVIEELGQSRAKGLTKEVLGELSSKEASAVLAELSATGRSWVSQIGTGGPEKEGSEYTLKELRSAGTQVSEEEGVRRYKSGVLWLRHVPVSVFQFPAYIGVGDRVERDWIYVGGFIGWESESSVPLTIVTYDVATDENGTQYATNVVESHADVSASSGYFYRQKIGLPVEHGEERHITIWADGERGRTQWTFTVKANEAGAFVPSTSAGSRVVWAGLNIGGPFLLTLGVLLFPLRLALRKMGVFTMWGIIEYGFIGMFAFFISIFLLFDGILEAFVLRPQLIGVLGGLVGALLAIHIFGDSYEKALLVQPSTREVGDETEWHWANRVVPVVERSRDGKTVVPRRGVVAAISRLWPGYDAAPLLEFDSSRHREITPPPNKADPEGFVGQIKTWIIGTNEDAFQRIYVVDPLAPDVMDRRKEGLGFELPEIVSWPTPRDDPLGDEPAEIPRIAGMPIPSINFAWILGFLITVPLVGLLVLLVTTSAILGMIGALVTALLWIVRPQEGYARVALAPYAFDEKLSNVLTTIEGSTEAHDLEHWRNKALSSEAKRLAERADEIEGRDATTLRELADRLAPEDSKNGARSRSRSGSKDVDTRRRAEPRRDVTPREARHRSDGGESRE